MLAIWGFFLEGKKKAHFCLKQSSGVRQINHTRKEKNGHERIQMLQSHQDERLRLVHLTHMPCFIP